MKEKRSQELDRLLVKAMAELKRQMFPGKHTKLLYNNIEVCLADLNKDKESTTLILGDYETIKGEKEWKFSHKIRMDLEVFNSYMNFKDIAYKYGNSKRYFKKYYKDRLMGALKHEILHAYTYEQYGFGYEEYRFNGDGSPIFVAICEYLNVIVGHKTGYAFGYSKIHDEIMSLSSFKEVEHYLIHLMLKYEKTFKKLSCFKNGNLEYANRFRFSCGDITGIIGKSTAVGKKDNITAKVSTFILGANVDVDSLEYLVRKKIRNNTFEEKYVMALGKEQADKRNKLKLQSMDI